jgi:hypothetical protein
MPERTGYSLLSSSSQARSLDILTNWHLNKMPFSGVLTKIDQASDTAPSRSGANASY